MAYSGLGYPLYAPVSLPQYSIPLTLMCWIYKSVTSFGQNMGFMGLNNLTFSNQGSFSSSSGHSEIEVDSLDYTKISILDYSANFHQQTLNAATNSGGWIGVVARWYYQPATTSKRDVFVAGTKSGPTSTGTALTSTPFNYLLLGGTSDAGVIQPGFYMAHAALWTGMVSDADCVLLSTGRASPLSVMPENLYGYWPLMDIYDRGPRRSHLTVGVDPGYYPFYNAGDTLLLPAFQKVQSIRFPTLYHFFTSDANVRLRSSSSVVLDVVPRLRCEAASRSDVNLTVRLLAPAVRMTNDVTMSLRHTLSVAADINGRISSLGGSVEHTPSRLNRLVSTISDISVKTRWAGSIYISAIPVRWLSNSVSNTTATERWLAAATASDVTLPVHWLTTLVITTHDELLRIRYGLQLAPTDWALRLNHLNASRLDASLATRQLAASLDDRNIRARWLSNAFQSVADAAIHARWLGSTLPTDAAMPIRQLTGSRADTAIMVRRAVAFIQDVADAIKWLIAGGNVESEIASFRLDHLTAAIGDAPIQARFLTVLEPSDGAPGLRTVAALNAVLGLPERRLAAFLDDIRLAYRGAAAQTVDTAAFLAFLGAVAPSDALLRATRLSGLGSDQTAPLHRLAGASSDALLALLPGGASATAEIVAAPLRWLTALGLDVAIPQEGYQARLVDTLIGAKVPRLSATASDVALRLHTLATLSADMASIVRTLAMTDADAILHARWLVFSIPSIADRTFMLPWLSQLDFDVSSQIGWLGPPAPTPSVIADAPVDIRLHVEIGMNIFDPPPVVFGDMNALDSDKPFTWDFTATMAERNDFLVTVASTVVERADGQPTSSADLVVSSVAIVSYGNKLEWGCQANGAVAKYLITFTLNTRNGNTLIRTAIISTKKYLG